jgi:hypothetical protein
MSIVRLLGREAFSPENITPPTAPFEGALHVLELVDRTDPLTELVAKKIIERAQARSYSLAGLCSQIAERLRPCLGPVG